MKLIAAACLALLPLTTGCAALLEAAIAETEDDGRHPTRPAQSHGAHLLDALDDDDHHHCRRHRHGCGCHTTVIVRR